MARGPSDDWEPPLEIKATIPTGARDYRSLDIIRCCAMDTPERLAKLEISIDLGDQRIGAAISVFHILSVLQRMYPELEIDYFLEPQEVDAGGIIKT